MCELKSLGTYSGKRLIKDVSMSTCILLIVWSCRDSVGLISIYITKMGWLGCKHPEEHCSLRAAKSKKHWPLMMPSDVIVIWESFIIYGLNLTKPALNSRTEPLEELQPMKKNKQSFAVDFSIRIVSVSFLGYKLDCFRAGKCLQSLKSHTRVNAAKCSVSVRVRKIISVFLCFYYLSWKIKPPGIINSQRLPV